MSKNHPQNKLIAIATLMIALFSNATTAVSFPEFVRHGYFSCTSCHVSPAGGGVLTDYGRSYSAEKLSAASYKGEEEPLHGIMPGEAGQGLRNWFLMGGNVRQVQTATENKISKDGRWIHMQRDIELCAKGGPATACATYGITKHGIMSSDGKTEYGVRKATAQVQAGESWLIRAGRFSPRFGVMIPDHNAWIQSLSGRGIKDERDQAEVTYMSEKFEITIARDQGRSDDQAVAKGYLGNISMAVTETIRAGVSYRLQDSALTETQTTGLFGAIGIDEKTFLLAELDRQQINPRNATGAQAIPPRSASFVKFGRELKQGFVTYAIHQSDLKQGKWNPNRREMYGLGLQVFPRPHFEFEATMGKVMSPKDFTYANTAYLLLHYYL